MKYRAFISYCHTDELRAKKLHRALENYRIPKRLVGRPGADREPVPKRLRPIFLDREELSSGPSLTDQVNTALRESGCLIVLCSPSARASLYVEREILEFQGLGRQDRILAALVNSGPRGMIEDALPRPLRENEPLVADLEKDGFTNAKLKLISGILEIGFDDLKQRETRRTQRRTAVAVLALVAVLLLYVLAADANVPVFFAGQIRRHLDEHNWSIARPVPSDRRLLSEAARFRSDTVRQVSADLRSPDTIAITPDGHLGGTWGLGQGVAAIAAAPEATPEQIEEARRQIELIFEPGRPIEAGGVKFGWLWFQLKNPQAEAALWPVIAVSALLARSDGVASAERLQFRNDLHYAESAANLYFTPSGGWNHLPHQEPADLHALYTTLTAFEAMLAVRDAGETWPDDHGSDCLSQVTSATFDYLLAGYDHTGEWQEHPGWHGTGEDRQVSPHASLSLLAYALLLKSIHGKQSAMKLSDNMLADMAARVEELTDSEINAFATDEDHLRAQFTGPDGKSAPGGYDWKVEWMPYAIAFAAAWMNHLRDIRAPGADLTAARRLVNKLLDSARPVELQRSDFYRADLLYRLDQVQ